LSCLGRETANSFELTDPVDQRQRLAQAARGSWGFEAQGWMKIFDSTGYGMPPTGGLELGLTAW